MLTVLQGTLPELCEHPFANQAQAPCIQPLMRNGIEHPLDVGALQ